MTFKSTFFDRVTCAIVNSNNLDAATPVKALGYKWLNGALDAGGFFTAGPPPSGLWLAGTCEMGLPNPWPVARINTLIDQGVGQAMTCIDMMKMYALLDSRQLVDGPSSDEMLDLLRRAQSPGSDPSFLTRTSVLGGATVSYDVTHTKIGLGPLKPANGGFDVASEVDRVTATARFTPGQSVRKRGFQTRVTKGFIVGVFTTVQWTAGRANTFLLQQLEVAGASSNPGGVFCVLGDSGSLVLDDATPTAVGLLWGEKMGGQRGIVSTAENVELMLGIRFAF